MLDASVIIIGKNEADNIKMTLDSLITSENKRIMEIIVVDDGSDDGCCNFIQNPPYDDYVTLIKTPGLGTSNARNLGASHAKGDILFFCDSHVTVPNRWLDDILDSMTLMRADLFAPAVASLTQPDAICYGLSINRNGDIYWSNKKPISPCFIPFVCSCFMAIKTSVFHDIGGFDRHYKIYGSEDAELSLKAWLFGYNAVLHPDIVVNHLFKESYTYQFDWSHMNYNILWMACSHYNAERLSKILKKITSDSEMKEVVEEVLSSGVWNQRTKYQNRRVHDDDWFFSTFNIPF